MSDDDAALSIDIVRGTPTDEELAALIAVVSEAYTSEARRAPDVPVARSRWERAARPLRSGLRRDLGWGGFSG